MSVSETAAIYQPPPPPPPPPPPDDPPPPAPEDEPGAVDADEMAELNEVPIVFVKAPILL